MRFMMLMIPKGYESAEAGTLPEDAERVGSMMDYNRRLRDAGVLVAMDGLYPPADGARVSFATGRPTVVDGPFAEVKEVVGGYWVIDVASRDEAIAWAKQCPGSPEETIEIRRIMEFDDFVPEVREKMEDFEEMRQRKD